MGSVWKAEDPMLGRDVALKFLPPAVAQDSEARKRFLRGARAASVLNHPGIGPVFDAGEADGQIYVAFGFVDGKTLRELQDERKISIKDAVRMVEKACVALGHAHSKKILHRDVKSANIMVTHEGSVVVVDFGLARLEGGTALTDTGMSIGTPAYMAPEVIRGKRYDSRADLYGLGVVLYELLAGRLPFVAERQEALAFLVVNENAVPPSEHNPDVPPELDAIVARALAKDPQGRYQKAGDFVRDLRAFADGNMTSISALAPAPARPARRAIRRAIRHRLFWPVVIGALAVMVILAVKFITGGQSGTYASVAVLPLEIRGAAGDDISWLSSGISLSLTTRLTHIPGIRVSPWHTSRQFNDSSQSLIEVARALGVQALVTGYLEVRDGRIRGTVSVIDGRDGHLVWEEEFDERSEDLVSVQKRIAVGAAMRLKGSLTGEEEVTLAELVSENVDAIEFYYRGAAALEEGGPGARTEALALFESAVKEDPELAEAYVGIGGIQMYRVDLSGWSPQSVDDAQLNFLQALRLDPESIPAKRGLIRVYASKGARETVLSFAKEAEPQGEESIEQLIMRGEAYLHGGLHDRAVDMARKATQVDPDSEVAHWLLAWATCYARAWAECIEAGERFVQQFREDPEVHYWVASSYLALGEFDIAALYFERSQALYEEPWIYTSWALAVTYEELGESDKSKTTIEETIRRLEKQLMEFSGNNKTRGWLAAFYGLLGDQARAAEHRQAFLADPPWAGMVLRVLVVTHLLSGEFENALELLILGDVSLENFGRWFPFTGLEREYERLRESVAYQKIVVESERYEKTLRALY